MTQTPGRRPRVTLDDLLRMRREGRKIAMLTAYDFPTAAYAQAAGVQALLVGDSLATVILGHESTRSAPLELMLTLTDAVRRGAPDVYLIGDMPYEALAHGVEPALRAAERFVAAGADAVKFEAEENAEEYVRRFVAAGLTTMVHVGLRPQQVLTPDGYRAQARDADGVTELVELSRRLVAAGAAMLLIEAVPAEAAAAVVAAVDVPCIGCGAGPACHGHILVTQDMLGIGFTRPPKFVPVHAQLGREMQTAMQRWVEDIENGVYPRPEHTYPMRKPAGTSPP